MSLNIDIYNSVAACAWAIAAVVIFAMKFGGKK